MVRLKETINNQNYKQVHSQPHQIKEIISCFPIGEPIEHCSEPNTDITLKSVILGYEINGPIIFALNKIDSIINTNHESIISINIDKKDYVYARVTSFCIILPGTAGEECTFKNQHNPSLNVSEQLHIHNSITITAPYQQHGIINLKTKVRGSILPNSGHYRSHTLILLDATMAELDINEQSNNYRINTKIATTINLNESKQAHNCMMTNYSEISAQITFKSNSKLAKTLKPQNTFKLTIKIEAPHKAYILGIMVIRVNDESAIISFNNIISRNQIRAFAWYRCASP